MSSEQGRPNAWSQVWLLGLSNALAFSATPLLMLIGSLVGKELAPSASWATLPIASMVVGSALGIIPVTQCMQHLGRKRSFILFMGLGASACWITSLGLVYQSFSLFCFGTSLLGVTNSAIQQTRFAGMEAVAIDKAPTAASIVMCGGIFAAILGPELALIGRHYTAVEYEGSLWLVAGCFLIALLIMLLYRPAKQASSLVTTTLKRPLSAILANRSFILALVSGAAGFAIMTFIMTGTPISMHHHHGHSLVDTKWVIQSHIAAMFLPSLVTPWLFKWFKIKGVILLGLLCYTLTIIIGLIDSSVMGYWLQLVALGIGWNFLFVSGTALLPSTHLPEERFRAQRFNDTLVFSCQALASLSAGWAINHTSWQAILLFSLVPMTLVLIALLRDKPKPELTEHSQANV